MTHPHPPRRAVLAALGASLLPTLLNGCPRTCDTLMAQRRDRPFRSAVELQALLGVQLPGDDMVEYRFAPSDTLRLITHRDIRSLNSWLHNVPRLVRSQHPDLLMHPEDAERFGLSDGETVELWAGAGAVILWGAGVGMGLGWLRTRRA